MSWWTSTMAKESPLYPYLDAYRKLVTVTRSIEHAARALHLTTVRPAQVVMDNISRAQKSYAAANGKPPTLPD
jgi:hypothetical protein